MNFEPEPDNPKNQQAIKALTDGCHIGYVCRGLLRSFHKWMELNYSITATVERVNGIPDNPKVFAFVEVRE